MKGEKRFGKDEVIFGQGMDGREGESVLKGQEDGERERDTVRRRSGRSPWGESAMKAVCLPCLHFGASGRHGFFLGFSYFTAGSVLIPCFFDSSYYIEKWTKVRVY